VTGIFLVSLIDGVALMICLGCCVFHTIERLQVLIRTFSAHRQHIVMTYLALHAFHTI
jgi:hypothetical protein